MQTYRSYRSLKRPFVGIVFACAALILLASRTGWALTDTPPEPTEFEKAFVAIGIAEHGHTEPQSLAMLGRYYMGKDDERAQRWLLAALDQDDSIAQAWFDLGILRMDDPVIYFKRVIELEPSHAQAHYWLASYYCRSNRTEESIRQFKQYLDGVDLQSPEEQGRIRTARFFISAMQRGITDYDEITELQSKPAAG